MNLLKRTQPVRYALASLVCLSLFATANLPSYAGPSATLDSSFAIGTGAGFPTPGAGNWGQVQAVAIQADGKVLAGGQALFTNFNGTPVPSFCRINVDGSLDTAFQANVGTGPLDVAAPEVNSIVIQPDGKILIGGPFTTVNGFSRQGVARLLTNGVVDTTFLAAGGGVNGTFTRYVNHVSLQADGKILIAGGFNTYLGTSRPGVARLNSDGTLDTTFNPGSPAIFGANVVEAHSDGKIYVAGGFTNWLGLATPGIVRLHSNGSLDTSFIPTHSYPYPSIGAMSVLGDGRVLIGGFVEGTEGNVTRYFARLNSDGSLDSGYPAGGVDGWVGDIVPWPGGGHLVMGRFRNAGGQPRGELALLDNDGNVDLDFAPPPIPLAGQDLVHIYCAAVAPDGKIVVGGWFTNYPNNTQLNGQDYSGIARLIGGFTGGPGTIQFTSAAQQVSEDAGTITVSVSRFAGAVGPVSVSYATVAGTASAGSDYTSTNGTLSWAAGELGNKTIFVPISSDVAAEGLENFTIQLSAPTGGATLGLATSTITIVDNDSPPTIVTQPQNTSVLLTFNTSFRVVVGPGLPTTYQWLSNNVAIANATNPILNFVNVQTNFATSYSVIVSNSIGFITSSNAVLTVLIPAGLPEPSFAMPGVGFNSDVSKIVFGNDGSLIVVGSFNQFGGVSIPNYIAKINSNGSRDTSFPPTLTGAQSVIQTIAAYPDGRLLIGGNFTSYAGTNRSRVARLLADGSLDVTFTNSAASASGIYAVLPRADGSAFVGESSYVRKFTPTGAGDTNWTQAGLIGQVYALAQQTDGKILAAPYRSGAPSGAELIRLNTNGTRDLTFSNPGRFAGGQIQTLKLLPDGRIFVGGGFTNLIANEITNALRYAAIFHPDGTLDTSFNTGTGPSGSIIESFVQPDGRILVGGAFSTWNGVAANGFARVLPNGQLDPTFVIGTGINNSFVRAIAMDAAGRIAIGGSFTAVNGQPRGRLALLTHDGGAVQLTTSSQRVNEQGGSVTVSIERVAGSRDALSVNYSTVAGIASSPADFTATNGLLTWTNGEYGVKTFNVAINNDADTEADETFTVILTNIVGGVGGLFTNQTIQILDNESAPRIASHPASLLVAEENNAVFAVSAFSALPISYQWRSNGVNIVNATNSSFSLFNVVSNNAANYSVRVSNSVNFLDSSNAVLTVIASPTRRDASFVASPAFNGAVTAIYPLGDGRVMVGGSFTQPRTRIALLNANGTVDGSFTNTATSVGGSTSVYDIERDGQGRWLIAGSFGQFGGVIASNLVRLNADYSVDTNFLAALGRGPNEAVTDVAVGPDGKIWVAGGFTSIGSPFGVNALARLNDDGSLDLSFTHRGGANATGSSGASFARVIPLPDGGALLGGSFNYYGGVFGSHLRKCFADGSLNPSFTPSVSGAVSDMILLPDGSVIASGNFSSPSPRMLKFKPNGALDSSFLVGVTANDSVNSLALQSNGRIVAVGAFTSLGIHTNRFTRVNADGTQDSSLSLGSGFSSAATRVALEHTGEIWVGGAFTQYKGSGPGYLVRLIGDEPTVAIGQQPYDRVIAPGQNTTFSITADGSSTLTYQWLKEGSPLSNGGVISGANTATLTLTGAALLNAGNYSVTVSNATGATATSRTASLTVQGVPTIVIQPVSQFVPVNAKLFLKVQAQGAATLGYQWLKDGSPIGVNSPNYILNNAPLSADGDYRVIVSNSFGSVTSEVAVVTISATPATAAPGFFADAGSANVSDTIYALQPLPDGRLFAGGSFVQVRTNGATLSFRERIALFNTNGTVAAFNPSVDNQITKILRQRDGKILVAGNFNNVEFVNRRFIARFNADLTFDTNFHNALFKSFSVNGPESAVTDMALQADGKILLTGGFGSVTGAANTRGVARLNTDGSVDDSFVSGVANFGSCSAVEVLPDGRILLFANGGYGGHISSLYRVSPNGTVDPGFTVSANGSLSCMAVQTNGAILVAGSFTAINGSSNALIARLIGNAQVDTNFVTGITNATAQNQVIIRTMAVQENGRILVGGTFLTFGPFRNGLARFNADGSADSTFIFQQGIGDDYTADVNEIALFADGRIAVGGRFATWEGTAENGLAILNGDPVLLGFASQPVDQFVPTGTTVQFSAQAVGEPVIGYQWFRGISPLADTANISGATTPSLTVNGATEADAGLYSLRITNGSGTRLSLPAELFILGAPIFREQPNGGIYFTSNSISLRATVLGIAPISYQWLLNSNIIANATNISLSFTNLNLTNSGDYQLVASNTLGAVTSVVAKLTVLNPPATLSGTWPHPAGANSGIYAVAPLGDGRVMVGGSFSFAGTNGNQTARVNLALLNTNGTVDAGFNPAPDNRVSVIRRDSAGRFLVGGWFNNIGGQPRNYFVRLNSDGSLDTNFLANLGSGPNGFVYDIAVRFDGKILVAGSFATVSGQSYPGVVRLNDNGTIDSAFRLNVPFAPQIQCIATRRSDLKIYIGGFINVSNRQNLVRLEPNGAVDLSFTANTDNTVNRIISLGDDRVMLGGNFNTVNGSSAPYLARLEAAGSLDLAWPQTRPNQPVQDILQQANGKLVAIGSFSLVGISRNQIARYNEDGSLDTSFAPGTGFVFNTPRALALESDGRIWVGGSFTTYNGTSVNHLVLLTGDPFEPASHLNFQGWAIFAGLVAGNNQPGQDPDADNVPNVFEYYFGTSPTNAASAEVATGTSVTIGNETYPAITFVRAKDTVGVTLLPQASSSVNFSDSLGTTVHSIVDLGNWEQVTIRSTTSDAVQSTQFLRIQLSVP